MLLCQQWVPIFLVVLSGFFLPSSGISPCGWTDWAVMLPPTLGAALLCSSWAGSDMWLYPDYHTEIILIDKTNSDCFSDYDCVWKTLRTWEMYLVKKKQTKRLLIYFTCKTLSYIPAVRGPAPWFKNPFYVMYNPR